MYQTIRLNLLLLCTIFFGQTCFAQNRPQPKQAPPRPSAPFLQYVKSYEETTYVTKIVMKNGMTVLVDEFRILPLVSVQAHVRTGFFDDPPQAPGVAGLVGAVVHRGMPDKSGGSYRQKVQALGGMSRFTVDYSTTLFEIVAPSGQWKRALGVQSEAIQNPSFDAEGVKLEARMMRAEARAALDDPQTFAKEKLLEASFNQPRMAKNSIIASSTPESISPDTLSAFYRAMYTPARMLLVISGDVSAGEVLNEIVRLYTRPAVIATKPTAGPAGTVQNEFRYISYRGNIAAPHLFFGFHTVSENDDDSKPIEVLNAILGLGEASALSARIRDERKLILSAHSGQMSSPEFGFFSIGTAVNPADIDQSEIAILTEMELLKKEEPTEADMERAFAQLERNFWAELETVTGRACALARFEILGDWKRLERHIADLRKVKPSDVKRAASKYLRLQNCTLLEFLPFSAEERLLTADAVRNTFSSLLTASAFEEQARRDKQTVLAIKIPPARTFKFNEVRYPFQTASILRGPALFIREDHSNPLIEMGLFFPSGKLDEIKENAGITRLMTALLLRGAEDTRQFYRQLEVYGGRVRPIVSDDYFGVYLSVLSQNFEPAFRQILTAVREPHFDEAELNRQKEIQLLAIRSARNSRAFADELMQRALFGNFPYSVGGDGTELGVGSLTVESVKAWYESHVRNRKPIVTIIGDTKGTSLASIFVQNFSGSRIQDAKIPEGYAEGPGKAKTSTQDWEGSESLISVGFQAPPVDDEDAFIAAVLEGYSGGPGKFSQEIKERTGAAHRVSVEYHPRLRGGSMTISAAAVPGTEEILLKTLREEIQKAHDGPIPYRDFRSAVSEAVGAYNIRQQMRFAQIADITEIALTGKGIETYQGYVAGLEDVREEDLKAFAQKIFNLDKATILVLRGKNKN